MAKRLTEDDIRRIFREEADLQRMHEKAMSSVTGEAREVSQRLKSLKPHFDPRTTGLNFDWAYMVQQVIDTYWEVVEEDLNAQDSKATLGRI